MQRFIDSFDHYATADRLKKWSSEEIGVGTFTITSGAARLGGFGLHFTTSSAARIIKQLDAQQTWTVGFALNVTTLPGSTTQILMLRDAGSIQMDVRISPAGILSVTRNGTVLATGTHALSLSTWYYIEFKSKIDPTTGTYELRINGVTEVSGTGANTRATANSTADQISLGNAVNTSATWDYDDLYIFDGQGSTNNDFVGDVRVEARLPDGNGNSSQLVGSDGNSTDNYLLVDESTPNSDTDYVESSTVGDKDTYTFQNLTPGSGTVYGVQIGLFAKKTDAGTRSVKSVARLSGTETDSADETLSTTYQYLFDTRETKPGGGSWTVSDVNSAEFGVKVSA